MSVTVGLTAKKGALKQLYFRDEWFSPVSIVPTVIIFIHTSHPLHNLSNLEHRKMTHERYVTCYVC